MPAKNSVKEYLENGFYHIYNRGVEKRLMFIDEQDYSVFLRYLNEYLVIKDINGLRDDLSRNDLNWHEKDKILKRIGLNNFHNEITLLCYCLMPNHFHFLIQQKGSNSIDSFIQSLCTRYSIYFNKKYKRVGPLYQGVYKAVLIKNDEQLLQVSGYIHKQAIYSHSLQGVTLQAQQGDTLRNSRTFTMSRNEQPSSYYCYTGKEKCEWVNSKIILDTFFQNNQQASYCKYVEDSNQYFLPDKIMFEE